MKAYLDTSVILRKLLGEPRSLPEWGRWTEGFTSEITRVECLRTLDRLRLQGELEDDEMAQILGLVRETLEATHVISLNAAVLESASQNFPVVLGTLDAVHLTSALLLEKQRELRLVFLTHDERLALGARAMGLDVRGVEAR